MATATKSYNPGFLTDEELRAMFCVRVGDWTGRRASVGRTFAILEELIAADDAAARERDQWSWSLAFARMAVGDVDRAAAFFADAMADSSHPVPVPAAFNAAMADWATTGIPSRDSMIQPETTRLPSVENGR